MSEADQDQLIADHFLFDKPVSPLLTCAGMARDWPDARGLFRSNDSQLFATINSDFMDHLRLCAVNVGGNCAVAFQTCCRAVDEVEDGVSRLFPPCFSIGLSIVQF